MRRLIVTIVIASLLAATSGFAADEAPAASKPSMAGPLALQITGGVLAGLGTVVAVSASRSDDIGADAAATMGLVGVGIGAVLFAAGTIWRFNRAHSAESAAKPGASLEIDLLGSVPALVARGSF